LWGLWLALPVAFMGAAAAYPEGTNVGVVVLCEGGLHKPDSKGWELQLRLSPMLGMVSWPLLQSCESSPGFIDGYYV
jgi:hypothetical protein